MTTTITVHVTESGGERCNHRPDHDCGRGVQVTYRNAAESARALAKMLGRNPTVEEMRELGFETNANAIRQAVFTGRRSSPS